MAATFDASVAPMAPRRIMAVTRGCGWGVREAGFRARTPLPARGGLDYDGLVDERFGEMLDTPPEQRRKYYELIRGLSVADRARKVVGLCRTVRALAVAGIRATHPDAGPEEIRRHLLLRLYGRDATRLFGPAAPRSP